ncbi:hypothetical protein AVEN_237688-1 [Araneus ventricosus]|uniref:Uncharacterized protein n=1 Tax=Araneus ventricosus TaxID=182803 RepID=A0A4Y2EQL2_ARAVE|nr:hypothetical protein AVEN_237688-1 [Araneus ventricosus]
MPLDLDSAPSKSSDLACPKSAEEPHTGWSGFMKNVVGKKMIQKNSNLPPSFVNEVVKIVEDETIVRSNLKSVSDVYSWIEEYGRTSDTKRNLRSSRPFGTGLVCW